MVQAIWSKKLFVRRAANEFSPDGGEFRQEFQRKRNYGEFLYGKISIRWRPKEGGINIVSKIGKTSELRICPKINFVFLSSFPLFMITQKASTVADAKTAQVGSAWYQTLNKTKNLFRTPSEAFLTASECQMNQGSKGVSLLVG